jgi:hypothetical protein
VRLDTERAARLIVDEQVPACNHPADSTTIPSIRPNFFMTFLRTTQ